MTGDRLCRCTSCTTTRWTSRARPASSRQVAKGDLDKIKGIERISKSRRALLPYGAAVLQEIIRAIKPAKIVDFGARRARGLSLRPASPRGAAALGSADLGGRGNRAAALALGRPMRASSPTGPAPPLPPSASRRPRTRPATGAPPACWPTSAGARIPNIAARSRSTSSRTPPSSASIIPAAPIISLTNLYRHEGIYDDAAVAGNARAGHAAPL